MNSILMFDAEPRRKLVIATVAASPAFRRMSLQDKTTKILSALRNPSLGSPNLSRFRLEPTWI